MNGMTTIVKIELELYFMINNTKAKKKKKKRERCVFMQSKFII